MHTGGTASRRPRAQAGVGLVEYALILSLIGILSIGAALFLGGSVSGALSSIGGKAQGAVAGASAGPDPGSFTDRRACEGAGFTWDHGTCRAPQADDFEHDQSGCRVAGFYWYGGDCHASPQATPTPTPAPTRTPRPTATPAPTRTPRPTPQPPSTYDGNKSGCLAAGYSWHWRDSTCH